MRTTEERLDVIEKKIDEIYKIIKEIRDSPHMKPGVNYDVITEIALYNYLLFMTLDADLRRGDFATGLPVVV